MGTCHTVKTAKPTQYQPVNLDQNEDQNAIENAILCVEQDEPITRQQDLYNQHLQDQYENDSNHEEDSPEMRQAESLVVQPNYQSPFNNRSQQQEEQEQQLEQNQDSHENVEQAEQLPENQSVLDKTYDEEIQKALEVLNKEQEIDHDQDMDEEQFERSQILKVRATNQTQNFYVQGLKPLKDRNAKDLSLLKGKRDHLRIMTDE